MSTKLKMGTYRLTRDFPTPKEDKRSVDWRKKAFVPAGTLFHVIDPTIDGAPEGCFEAHPVGLGTTRINNGKLSPWKDLFELLEPVPDKPTYWLERERSLSQAGRILDALVKSGKLTLDEIKAAVK